MKRTLNKLMALLCTMAILMTLLPAIPAMAADEVTEISGTGVTMTAGSYKLTGETTLSGQQTLTGDLTIDLNGQTLKGTAAPYFTINDAYTLTITDSQATDEWKTNGGGQIVGRPSGGGVDGMIYLTYKSKEGDVITPGGGVFNLQGGTLTGHVASGATGAIRSDTGAGATINMTGGKITGNYCATNASAIMLYNNTLNMSGGVITGNAYAEGKAGGQGAIWFNAGGVINMTGGEIYGNNNVKGDNIYSNAGGVLNISGGVVGKAGDDNAVWNTTTASKVNASGSAVIGGGGIVNSYAGVTVGNLTAGASIMSAKQVGKVLDDVKEEAVTGGYLYTSATAAAGLSGTVEGADLAAGGEFVLSGDVSLNGAVTLAGNLTIDLAGHTLTGNVATPFDVPKGTVLTIKDSSGTEANQYTDGTGKVTLAEGTKINNSNGIVYAKGTFNLEGGTLTGRKVANNSAYNAGAVRVGAQGSSTATMVAGEFNMSGGVITGNSGNNGAAVILYAGTMKMSGGKIHDNHGPTAASGAGQGGGIWINKTDEYNTVSEFHMTGGEIYNNTAAGDGKNIELRGTMTMTGGTIGDSDDVHSIRLYNNTVASLTVSGNAKILGEGLYNKSAVATIRELTEGAEIHAKMSIANIDNTVDVSGDADNGFVYSWLDTSILNTNLKGELSQSAFAVPAEYTLTGDVTLTEAVKLNAGEFTIDLNGYTLTGAKGPFFTVPAGTTLTVKDSSETAAGKVVGLATDQAGYQGMFYLTGGTLNVQGGTFTGHASTSNIGVVRLDKAGSVLNMYGGVVTGNTGKNIGAVAVYGDTVFNMYGGTVTGNKATSGDGGAVYVYSGGTVNVFGGTIGGNTASRNGQNIYSYGSVNVYGGTVGTAGDKDALYLISTSNMVATGAAVIGGGGIANGFARTRIGALKSGASVISAGKLSFGNDMTVVETENEGVYTYTGKALPALEGAEVLTADTVPEAGKTYYLTDDVTLSKVTYLTGGDYTIYLDGHTLSGKTAPYLVVGSAEDHESTLTICDRTADFGRILGQKAGADEMILVYGKLTLTGGDLTGHTNTDSSSGDGGAIKVYAGGTFEMTGGRITDNTATARGGALNVNGGGTFILSGGTISGNTAQYGGVLYANGSHSGHEVTNPVTVKVSGGTVTGNIATTGGSALYINDGTFEMTGGNISGNIVKGSGAAHYRSTIRLGGVAATITGGIIGDEAEDSTVANTILVGDNGSGDSAVYSSLALSGKPVITGTGINKYGTAAETVVTVADLEPGAEIVSQDQLTFDPEDENVEEYKDADGLWHYVKVRTLRVLSIGNSYSRDSFYYLTRLSLAVGQPIEAAYLYKGSCTLREHANYMACNLEPSVNDKETNGVAEDPSVIYSYYKANMDPASETYGDLKWIDTVNAAHALADGEWDIIMLHQGTTAAGFAGTYNADIDFLVDAIRAKQPNAKLYWNMIWAFDDYNGKLASGSDRANALKTYYNNDQATMYNAILQNTADNFIGEDAVYAQDFEGWFPVGPAIQTVRKSFGVNNLTRDGYHLSFGGGRLTAAMTILKVLRPTADLSLITPEEIAPYLDTTDDRLTTAVETFSDVFTGSAEQLDVIRSAVESVTADLTKAPAKLATKNAPATVEAATLNSHITVAQTTAPMKLHFADVAALADGTVIVSAYENVYHTPTTDTTKTSYNGFGSQGAGRLVLWTGDSSASNWTFSEPLLVIDQKQLEEWGIVSLSNRYAKLVAGKVTATDYDNYSDPRDPNVTVANIDMDGDGQKEEVLLLTFWVRNFRANTYKNDGTFMTWSTDGGETWAKAVKITTGTRLKRGDMAVFSDGQLLIPSYSTGKIYHDLVQWDVESQTWTKVRAQGEITDFAPDETNGEEKPEFNEAAFVAPNPDGDVVYGFIRANGIVVKSEDRGANWVLVANEDNVDVEADSTRIHQPGFARLDDNRVYVTWARDTPYPRNTIGKIFEVNNGWEATKPTTVYDMTKNYDWFLDNAVTGSRDSGDPSAELLADGKTVLVVTYDTGYRAIVGTKVSVAPKTVSGSVSAGTINSNSHTALKGDTTISGTASVSGSRTIDLAGSTLSGNISVPAGATLHIGDSSAGQNGVFNGKLSGAGTIVISGGTFANKPDAAWLAKDNAYVIVEKAGKYQVKPGLAAADGGYVNFGSTLDMGVYLQGDNGVNGMADYQVEASVGTATIAVDGATGKLMLSAKGIPAKNMRDDITYTVLNGDTVYYTGTMSIYDAAYGWYADVATDADVKVMLADMLNFGDEAHKALKDPNHTYEALEGSDGITGEWSDTTTAVTGGHDEKVAVTLSLKDNIQLIVYIDDANAAVSDVTFAGNSTHSVDKLTNSAGKTITRVTFGKIDMVNAKDQLSFTVTLSGGETFQVTTGIEEYVASAVGGRQSAVIQALQKYVDSVIRVVGNK